MGGVMYGVTHVINGTTHSGKGAICSKLFVRQGFFGWPGRVKPMVCQTYGLHASRGDHEKMTKTTKATQTDANKDLSAGSAEITETTEMTKTTGIRGANHGFPKQRVLGAET